MATPRPVLTALAEQTAVQIGFTLRRWWREKTEPTVLRVEVERCLVGAPSAIAVLTVPIPQTPATRPPSPVRDASPVRSQPASRPTRRATASRLTKTPRQSRGRQR
jgi:hypothetical protein